MSQCTHCQAELPANAQFCNRCGTPVEQEQNQSASETNTTGEEREDMPRTEQEQSQSPENPLKDAVNAQDTLDQKPASEPFAAKNTDESNQEQSMFQEEKNADETLILSREDIPEQPLSSTSTEEVFTITEQQPIKLEESAQAAYTLDEDEDDDTRPMPTPPASSTNASSAAQPQPAPDLAERDADTSSIPQSSPDLSEQDTHVSPAPQLVPASGEQEIDSSPAPVAQDSDTLSVPQPAPDLASQEVDAFPALQPLPVTQDVEASPAELPVPTHTKGPRPRAVLLIAIIVLLVLAGGAGAFALLRQQTSAGATSQCSGQPTNCVTTTPGAARANATRLTFSGKISGPMTVNAPARCQSATTGNLRTLTVTLSGTIDNQLYNFGFAIANYHGSSTYSNAAPTLTILLDTPGEATANGWGNTSPTDTGSITIARGEQSGSINYLLSGFGSHASTQVQISGNWTCD